MIRRAALVAIVLTCACSKLVGIEERSGDWCSIEAGVRDFCTTFDRDPVSLGWDGKLETGGVVTRAPSDRDNGGVLHATTMAVPALGQGAATLGTSLPRASGHMRTGFDMRIVENTVTTTPDKNLRDGYVAIFSVSGSNGSVQLALRKDGLYIVSFLTAESGPPIVNDTVPVFDDMTRLMNGTRVVIEIRADGDTTVSFDGVPVLRKINTGAALIGTSPSTAFALGLYVLGPAGPLDASFDNFTFELLE